jgi:DNA-binding NarL/FixJ family response regulator
MRILVADNDVRVRLALHVLLNQEPGDVVIAESSDLDGLAIQVREFKPDLVLLDWELRGRAAAALLFALNGLTVRPKVIVLSGRSDTEQAALRLGADGFVYKGDAPDRLLTVCRTTMSTQGKGSAAP